MESPSPAQSDVFILGNCLSCQGLVRVPYKSPAESTVRCPHCSESFRLSQILDQSVPELEIVDSSEKQEETLQVEEIAIKEREVFVVPPQLSKGAQRSKRRRSSHSNGSGSKTSDSSTNSRDSDRKSSRSSSARSRSSFGTRASGLAQTRKPATEMIKVALGGLLAIPIAYLLLLWGFGQDPLKVGPKIGNVAPFLVPGDLRGNPKPEAKDVSKVANEASDEEGQGDDSPIIPKLDPDGLLNLELDESK